MTWDTHFFTLESYVAQQKCKKKNLKQFINIEPVDSDVLKLTIALKIAEVNHQNIQKMMIMIRQYKNLSIGRHEYG
ncbi:MAG: hypothetical protein OQK58_06395 [Gammaproteobacteria bacterium]|nr:hypothetical protein [Gammaproteobacteria bacterium]